MSELQEGERYFLRGCKPGGLAYGGFVWPLQVGAVVTAPNWSPKPGCGGGLHGSLDGGGDPHMLVKSGPGLVVAARDAVDLGGEHKFHTCRVLHVGATLRDAATWLAAHVLTPVHYATATAADHGTATAGHYGIATVGCHGTATVGYCGTAMAGYRGTATAGDHGTATAGYLGSATAGYGGCVAIRDTDGAFRCKAITRADAGKRWRLAGDGKFEVVP